MNVYDKAYELARALRESSEVKDIKEAKKAIDADPDTKRMFDDFRSRRLELQRKMMSGETPSEDERSKLEKLYEVVMLNPAIRRMMEAERRLSVIVEDVQRIIAEPIGETLSDG
jgi:cell fate (sporulation/competence/biofilm development) regulator YlbF (YheA/YmcA/DUF963 family)